MVKVAFEAQRVLRKKVHGMDIVAINLINELAQNNEVELDVFTKKGDKDITDVIPKSNKTIATKSLPYFIWEQLVVPFMLSKRYSLAHFTSNTAPFYCPVPLILTLHDVIFLQQDPNKVSGSLYQKWGNYYMSLVVPRIVKKAKKIITVSEFEKNNIVNVLNINPKKIEVVYNGVSEHFLGYKPDEELDNQKRIKRKYTLPDQYVFFLGNTAPKKNLGNTIAGFVNFIKETKLDYKLVVADLSEEVITKELNSQQLGEYADRIQCTGYIENSDLPYIYGLADLFLYTSLRESFGIPSLEAMACSTPVVASNTTAIPEVVGEAAFLVDPYKIDSITNGINEVLSNKNLQLDLIEKGKKRANTFTWSNAAKKTLDIYKSIS